ncbi:MAG: tetratricopeptide repeat protein [Ignavibacteriales bacterium]|nr:tetratricopeptide repeat protein [Ignavibacteriales bacterium]
MSNISPKLFPRLFIIALTSALGVIGCGSSKETPSKNPDEQLRAVSSIDERNKERALRFFIDGSIRDSKGEHAEAILDYQAALEYDKNPAIYYAMSKDYSLLGKHAKAAETGKEAVRLDSTNIAYRENLAGIYLSAFQQDLAIREYEAIVRLDSNYTNGWFNLARLYQISRPLQAVGIYEMLLNREGDDWDLLLQAAETYSRLGRHEQAAEKYKRMLEIDPSNKPLQRQLAETLSKAGKIDEAVDLLQKMVEIDENDLSVVAVLADVYLDRGDFEKALVLYKKLLKNEKSNPEIKLRVGIAYIGQIQRDSTFTPKAKDIFLQLKSETPNDWRAYWYLAHIAGIEKQDSLSAHYFERVTQLAEGNADAWWYLGTNLFSRGDYQKLLEAMEKAKRALPKEHRVYLLMGLAYSRMDQSEKAAEALEQAYRLNAKDMDILSTLALTYDGLHRYEDSDRLYEEALKIDPKSHLILNNYSYSLAERGLQLERALEMAIEAVAAEPDNASYLDTLGWIYFKLGKLREAQEYIAKSVATGRASSVVHEHLGDIYYKMNEKDKAKEMWQKAFEMDGKNQSLKEKISRGSL